MLLNKIPCLDKGYVAYVGSSNNSETLTKLSLEFLKNSDGYILADISSLTVAIKCPLFVQLNLSKFNLKLINTLQTQDIETYVPNAGEVGGHDRETNRVIADDIDRTSQALAINPKAYQADGCDRFVSQILTPISTYTTLIVHGSYNEWKKFCNQSNLPAPIQAYVNAINQVLIMEWK